MRKGECGKTLHHSATTGVPAWGLGGGVWRKSVLGRYYDWSGGVGKNLRSASLELGYIGGRECRERCEEGGKHSNGLTGWLEGDYHKIIWPQTIWHWTIWHWTNIRCFYHCGPGTKMALDGPHGPPWKVPSFKKEDKTEPKSGLGHFHKRVYTWKPQRSKRCMDNFCKCLPLADWVFRRMCVALLPNVSLHSE